MNSPAYKKHVYEKKVSVTVGHNFYILRRNVKFNPLFLLLWVIFQVKDVIAAREFYENKLQKDHEMPRYNHMLASMKAAADEDAAATKHYRNALAFDENNIMLRNDVALHYSKIGRQQDAIDEMRKGLLFHPKHGTLHKNLAAIYARTGRYEEAQQHAQEALYTNPDDAQNHRNIANVYEMMGDTRRALLHNVQSITMEQSIGGGFKPATTAHRAAARQTIIRGGKLSDSIALMNAARQIDGKKYRSDTTQRTYEVLQMIAKRRGDQLYEMKKAEEKLMEKKKHEDAIRQGDVSSLLPDTHAIIRGPVRPLPEGRRKKKEKKVVEDDGAHALDEDDDEAHGKEKHKKHKKHKKKG